MNTPHQIILTALAKMEEGEKNVTPGPWFVADWTCDEGPDKTTVESQKPDDKEKSIWINGIVKMQIADTQQGENPLQDAAFIASSRTQIPLLRELLKQACGALEQIESYNSETYPHDISGPALQTIADNLEEKV